MTTIVLTDAATPAVNRNFVQVMQSPDLSVFKDYTTNGGYPIGAGTVTLSCREAKNGTMTVEGRISIPQLETVAGETSLGFVPAPQVAAAPVVSFKATLPARTSLQARKDLRAMLIDLLGDEKTIAAIENFVRP